MDCRVNFPLYRFSIDALTEHYQNSSKWGAILPGRHFSKRMAATPKTVLIIDDSPEDRQIYTYHLGSGYTVLEAGLGKEGLAMIRERRPDCVLLDYCLPDMNGQQILNTLNADGMLAHLAVILLTGHGDVRLAVSAMRTGAMDFLEKSAITGDSL